jgi:hypothetical protein
LTLEPRPVQGVVSLQQSSPIRRTAVPVRVPAAAETFRRMRNRALKLVAKLGFARSVTATIPSCDPERSV